MTLVRIFYSSHFMPYAKARAGDGVVPFEGDGLEVPDPCGCFCLHRHAPDAKKARDEHGFCLSLRKRLSAKDMCRCLGC